MQLSKKFELIALYDIYYLLFTKRQQKIFELYFDDDYSMKEVAQTLEITVSGVSKTIKEIEIKLYMYEKKLKIKENYKYNVKMLRNSGVDTKLIRKIK